MAIGRVGLLIAAVVVAACGLTNQIGPQSAVTFFGRNDAADGSITTGAGVPAWWPDDPGAC